MYRSWVTSSAIRHRPGEFRSWLPSSRLALFRTWTDRKRWSIFILKQLIPMERGHDIVAEKCLWALWIFIFSEFRPGDSWGDSRRRDFPISLTRFPQNSFTPFFLRSFFTCTFLVVFFGRFPGVYRSLVLEWKIGHVNVNTGHVWSWKPRGRGSPSSEHRLIVSVGRYLF